MEKKRRPQTPLKIMEGLSKGRDKRVRKGNNIQNFKGQLKQGEEGFRSKKPEV